MKPILHCDFETRSVLDLKEVGMYNYARHPSTDVWCVSLAVNDAEPVCHPIADIADPAMPWDLLDMVARGQIDVMAHNAFFELDIWNEIMAKRYGWPTLDYRNTYCTMVMAYTMGLPGGLEDASLALGLSVLKDLEGRALMLRMARPRRMEGSTPVWWNEPDKLARLHAYCNQDVRVEQALHSRLLPLSPRERRVWMMDYIINKRGVMVDLETARAGAVMAELVKERAGFELAEVTKGAVSSPNALIALKQWLVARGCAPAADSLDKEAVTELLKSDEWTPEVVRALEIRQEASKASVAKLDTMLNLAGTDSRLHDIVQMNGANTGRWAARGVQVHNLIRVMPPPEIVEDILASVRAGEIDWIRTAHGAPMAAISSCLRSFFVAPKGSKLIAGDFSGVESRGGAWFAGEQWKINAFQASDMGIGPGIYELSASRTLGVPIERITKDSIERQIGKVEELAFQYQGGVGAARKFLPAKMKDTKDSVLNGWKLAWREQHPKINDTWSALEDAAIGAVLAPGSEFTAGFPGRHVTFKKAGSFLWCKLPSGRVLCYPYPKLLPGKFNKDQLTYMTVPSEQDKQMGKLIDDVKNANNWARMGTYGGSLMENVIQALCRDLLVDAMLALHDRGYAIVLHVHDEIVIEILEALAEAARVEMEGIMRTVEPWAAGFPLWADCKIMRRYGK